MVRPPALEIIGKDFAWLCASNRAEMRKWRGSDRERHFDRIGQAPFYGSVGRL